MTFIITYETLFDILRKESSREDLQALPENFYSDVKVFLDEKQGTTGADAAGQRATIEYENTKKIIRELYDRRERKLLLLALNKARTESAIIDPSILLPEEKDLFDTLVGTLKDNKSTVMNKLSMKTAQPIYTSTPMSIPREEPKPAPAVPEFAGGPPAPEEKPVEASPGEVVIQEPEPETGGMRVKFVAAVPKFIGKDMTIFGPFNPGDETSLPEDIASVLLKKGRIQKVELQD